MDCQFHRGYLQVGEQQIYAGIRQPSSGEVVCSVVFAEPFGEEKRCSCRMLVRMADCLAENDRCAVMKFDFSGTGDSSGSHGDAAMVQWLQEMTAASRFMLQQFPGTGLVLAGLRAGALTAARAAVELPVKKLILLSPVLSGEELKNELHRRQKMKNLLMGREEDENGDDDFGGVAVSSRMMQELTEYDLLADLKMLPSECSIHLIHTTGAAKFPPPWKNLTEFLEQRPNSTLSLLRDKPFWGQLEYYESDLVQEKVQEVLHG